MQQLTGRLTALDPDAQEALRVIPYFDELLNKRAGLESVVRGAAVLSGAAARLLTPRQRVPLRVLPNGWREDIEAPPDPSWQCAVTPDRGLMLWLERPKPSGPVDAMVLERATQAVRTVLDRTDSGQLRPDYRELLALLLDPETPESTREHAARVLGYKAGQLVRVVAEADSPLQVLTIHADGSFVPPITQVRTGIGLAVVVAQAPTSARAATLSLRLSCEGTADDPGPRVVVADELGVIILLAAAFDDNPSWSTHPDLLALARASERASWLLETLAAVATTDSQRTAAAALFLHHSTLQRRLSQVQRLLGWDVMTPAGRLRLQAALLLRRLDLSRP